MNLFSPPFYLRALPGRPGCFKMKHADLPPDPLTGRLGDLLTYWLPLVPYFTPVLS